MKKQSVKSKLVNVFTFTQARGRECKQHTRATIRKWCQERADDVFRAVDAGAKIVRRLENPERPALLVVSATSLTVIPLGK